MKLGFITALIWLMPFAAVLGLGADSTVIVITGCSSGIGDRFESAQVHIIMQSILITIRQSSSHIPLEVQPKLQGICYNERTIEMVTS